MTEFWTMLKGLPWGEVGSSLWLPLAIVAALGAAFGVVQTWDYYRARD